MKFSILFVQIFYISLLFLTNCRPETTAQSVPINTDTNPQIITTRDTFLVMQRLAEVTDTVKLTRFKDEIAKFKAKDSVNFPKPGAVVFVGSSSIRKWRTIQTDFAPAPILNRGFGGSTVAEICRYAHEIIVPYKPAKVFLYAGDNDIANAELSVNEWSKIFDIYVDLLKYYLPNTKLYVISIKPSPARWHFQPKFEEANTFIKHYADSTQDIEYVDVADAMLLENGTVNPELFLKDKLHMNAKGYAVWTEVLKSKIFE